MKTGVNSVLWGGHPLEDAFAGAARAGYDGIELSAIPQMSEHLVLDRWAQLVSPIKELADRYGLELLAMEQPSQDPEIMEQAFEAGEAFGSPSSTAGQVARPATRSHYERPSVRWQTWPSELRATA